MQVDTSGLHSLGVTPLRWSMDAHLWTGLGGCTPLGGWTLGVGITWHGLYYEWTSPGWTLEMDASGLGRGV